MDPITLSLAKAYTEATAEGMGAVQGKPGPQGPVGPAGPQGPTGPAGPTGAKGEPGTNGVSPTVSVSPNSSNDGTVVTITDVNGTKSFEVLNGENGENGAPGPQGIPGDPGTPGAAGPAGPQGAQGIQGNPGEPFLIYKVYPTKADMDAGYATDGLQEGQLVGISTVTGGDDGGHLYIKGATAYEFFFDLATVDGIAGPTGPQGVQGPEGPQGPAGQTGAPGTNGADGEDGATFTPSVSTDGTLSWTNDGNLPNPAPVNIKGPAGADGADGENGVGVPAGGAAGQILSKKTAADYDTQWIDAPQGGGTDLTVGDGLTIADGVASVDTPVRGVLTEEEFNALPEAEQNKGMYVIPDADGGESPGESYENVYSTEKRRIGTWIDGRPLYRKTYVIENVRTKFESGGINYGILQVGDSTFLMHKVFGEVRSPSGSLMGAFPWVAFQYGASGTWGIGVLDRGGSTFIGVVSGTDAAVASATVSITATFEYTRSTDQPEVTS